MASVNEELLDRSTRHAVYLERLKKGQARKVVKILHKKAYPELLDKLTKEVSRLKSEVTNGRTPSMYRAKRYRDLISSMKALISSGTRAVEKSVSKSVENTASFEAEFQTEVMKSRTPKVFDIDYTTPNPVTLQALVKKTPMEGKLLADWFRDLDKSVKSKATEQLNLGLINGESIPQMRNRFRGIFKKTDRQLEAIVRTATAHAVNSAKDLTYKQNKDVVKAVKWVSTLDDRTTMTCASLDGKEFKVGAGPRPPIHWQCRSTTIPVLKSWKELGFDFKDVPMKDRESMNGFVPAKQSYGSWLKKQPAGVQNKVLGKTRAKMFRDGKITIDKFVDKDYRPLTLEQLKAREGYSKPKRAPKMPKKAKTASTKTTTAKQAKTAYKAPQDVKTPEARTASQVQKDMDYQMSLLNTKNAPND